MFTVADRERVRDRVLELAAADGRVVAGAVVGSLALADGDRWSDLDLTFGVRDGIPVEAVLADWTRVVTDEFAGVQLFDLPRGPSIYRVFLLPGCLQFDLSFTPAAEFGADGPKFRLLFGEAGDRPASPPPDARELFGYAVHHALRARFCIERGRLWQAEYWLSGVRDSALSLACLNRGLPAYYGRGFDDLPQDVREGLANALVGELDPDELRRALGCAIAGLVRESGGLSEPIADQLRALTERQ